MPIPSSSPTEVAGQPPRIEIRNLNKAFKRVGGASLKPVDNINLTVDHDEMVVLLGPSGCGKTTLLRCVAGLERPDSGEILINGVTVYSSERGIFMPPEQRNISMIFQSFALWPHLTVGANVAYPLESRGVPKAEARKRAEAVLELVGIGGLARQLPGSISGGQQQRVALARALVSNSTVVLFDEPLSSVDAKVREQLRGEIDRMQRRIQFSGLYVTHDQTEAMELGHRIAVLQSGRIAALGPPRDVYDNPTSEYVATFVGAANVWPGTLVQAGSAESRVDIGPAQLAVASTGEATSGRNGDKVSVIARPERLRLSATPEPHGFAVTVESRVFAGPHTSFVVRAGEAQAVVWQHSEFLDEELSPGKTAWLCTDPKWLRIVQSGSAAL